VDDKGGRPLSARPPTRQDLARIARALNEAGAKYAVIGGFAMLHPAGSPLLGSAARRNGMSTAN